MKFIIDAKIFEKYLGVEIGVIVIKGYDNSGRNEKILKLLRDEEAKQKKLLADTEMGSLTEIAVWREIYRSFGSHPKDYRSSVEALLRRARAGNREIPHINNLVDLYNYISLKYHLPVGAEDLDKIKGDLKLTFASGNEEGVAIGSDTAEKCDPGEVIYRDDESFICRKWNWREADRTKIEANTVNAFLVIEKAPGVEKDKVSRALEETAEFISKQLKGQTEIEILTKEKKEIEFTFQPSQTKKKQQDKKPPGEKLSLTKKPEKPSKKPTVSKVLLNPLLEGAEGETKSIIRSVIEKAVSDVYPQAKTSKIPVKIEHPENKDYGDYSTNLALILAGQLKIKPLDLADKLSRKIGEYIGQHQTISVISYSKEVKKTMVTVSDVLEKVKSAPPGFLNLYLTNTYLITQMGRLLTTKEPVRTIQNKKIVVEYTDPNPFKEFHIGHLISNVTGEAISRILEGCGATVWRADYFGDVGTHAAKSIWGIIRKMADENISLDELASKNLPERINFLGQGYALGTRAFEDPSADGEKVKAEIGRLNTVLYLAAQKMWRKQGIKPVIDYDPEGKISKEEVDKVYDLFVLGRQWSLNYFETIYQRLGTKFDGYYPESKVGEIGYKLVLDNIGRVFEKSEGAVVFKAEKFGLHTRVFINKHNLPTYEAKELGLAPAKYEDFKYDQSIIVVGKEIKEYFQVLVTALKQVLPELGNITYPVCTGMVKLPEGKMSSRSGNVVTVTGILDELKSMIKEKMTKQEYTAREKEDIAEKVAVGALKYSFLKNSIGQDFIFDFRKALSLEGDSGPYLHYTYARCQSVARKAGGKSHSVALNKPPDFNEEEKDLLQIIVRFEEVVIEAGRSFAPNFICTYLYDLAQKFNLFYQKHSILTAPNVQSVAFRLNLTKATASVLKKGLHLLGIETVERM